MNNVTSYDNYAGLLGEGIKNTAMLLYIVNPYETTFESLQDVPDFQHQIWFSFFILIALENVILFAKKGIKFRLNDHVTSVSHWILQESGRIVFRGIEYYAYILINEKFGVWNLAWNSPYTWYITAIAVDFCYYWVHRANHEVLFLWAHHQVHHSSEEFNLVVGLRQSILQQWCSFIFYLPLAIIIPPSHFVAHHQFNLIYQLWIHTTVIEDLGPLEWIFNTPRHHRVHHGCNLYCLDTNYGGVLIIWDRIFGTFAPERPKEEIIYGLVVSPQTYNPLYLQVFYAVAMVNRSFGMGTLRDKFSVFWKGPSWQPGLPRLGLDKYKVNVISRTKFDPQIPTWQNLYILLNFCLVLHNHALIYDEKNELCLWLLVINNMCTLINIGLLFDRSVFADILEIARCLTCFCLLRSWYGISPWLNIISCTLWLTNIFLRDDSLTKVNCSSAGFYKRCK